MLHASMNECVSACVCVIVCMCAPAGLSREHSEDTRLLLRWRPIAMLPVITPSVCSLLRACPLGRLSLGSLSYHERRYNNTLEKPRGKRKKRENAPTSPASVAIPAEAETMEWRSRLGCSSPSGHSCNQRTIPLNPPGSGAELWTIKQHSYLSHKFWSTLLHNKYSLKDLMPSTLVTH